MWWDCTEPRLAAKVKSIREGLSTARDAQGRTSNEFHILAADAVARVFF
jgi:hypothetical protein